jgi:outer membrane lipoprotein-sorting protein
MTMRTRRAPRALAAAALLLVCGGVLVTPGGASSQDPVDGILRELRSVPGMEARFREEKRIALLSTPLVNEGTVSFAPPSRLVRRTIRPRPSTLLIDGDRLVVGDASGRREIDLSANPVVRSFVDSFVGLLRGDRAALERTYRIVPLPAEVGGWSVSLRPKRGPVRRAIREIRARGQGPAVEHLAVMERNGDVSETTFTDIDTRRHYSPREIPRVFRIP